MVRYATALDFFGGKWHIGPGRTRLARVDARLRHGAVKALKRVGLAPIGSCVNNASTVFGMDAIHACIPPGGALMDHGAGYPDLMGLLGLSRTWTEMGTFNNTNFKDRADAAANARAALIEKMKARPSADDPAIQAKQAARRAIQEARQQREAEREATRQKKERQEAEEKAAKAAAEAAEAAERERHAEAEKAAAEEARLQRAAKILADEADRKAARDARYAARKAKR